MNYSLAVPFSGQVLFEASAGGLRTTHSAPPPELRQLFSRDAGIPQRCSSTHTEQLRCRLSDTLPKSDGCFSTFRGIACASTRGRGAPGHDRPPTPIEPTGLPWAFQMLSRCVGDVDACDERISALISRLSKAIHWPRYTLRSASARQRSIDSRVKRQSRPTLKAGNCLLLSSR